MFALLFLYEKDEYLRVVIFLGIGMMLFLVISTVFPNMLQLRPRVMPRDNFCTRMVLSLYSSDTATNVFPSIHVYNSLGCMLAARYSKRFTPFAKWLSYVTGFLIVLATMFLKQHSAYDVAGAFALAVVADYLVYHSDVLVRVLTGRRPLRRTAEHTESWTN